MVASCKLPLGSPNRNTCFFFIVKNNRLTSARSQHREILIRVTRSYCHKQGPEATLFFSHVSCRAHSRVAGDPAER
jgi:hypothetical protein